MEKAAQINSIFAKARESGEVLNLSDAYFGFANEYDTVFLIIILLMMTC
jgi:hypothetical protein